MIQLNKLSKCKKLRNLQVEKGYTFSIKDGGKFTDLTVKEVAIASNLNYSTVYYNIQFLALELADFLIEKAENSTT